MDNKSISEYALEVICTRLDRINHRLIVVLILAIVFLFGSNAAWLIAWMQYDYSSEATTSEVVTVDSDNGIANYANHGRSVVNGQSESSDYHDTQKKTD